LATEKLQKATNISTDVSSPAPDRVRAGPYSLFSLATLQGEIYEEAKKDLRHPRASKIYKQMLLDSSVGTPYALIEIMLSRPDWRVVAPKNSPEEEQSRAKMLNYNLASMERPWAEYIMEMVSYLVYGHWEGEKIFAKFTSPHGDFEGIKDLQTISQDSVEKWIFDEDTKSLKGIRQSLKNILAHRKNTPKHGYVDIPRIKFLHLRNSPKRNNPEGRSVLNSCYVDWKYKSVVEEYQTIGVTRDLGGLAVFQIHSEVLAKAAADPAGPEAILIERLKAQGQALHAGDLACGIVPVDDD